MRRVFVQDVLVVDGYTYHTLMISRQRSWRVDLYALRSNPIITETIELRWIGAIEPSNMDDTNELQALASDLIARKYKDL